MAEPWKDRWQSDDGAVVLYLGDCLDILPTLEPGSVDAVITDPPYGVSMPGVKHVGQPGSGARNFDFFPNDTPEESCRVARAAIAATEPLLKPHGSGYAWVGHRQFSEIVLDLEQRGWKTRFLVWSKIAPPPPPPGSGWPSAAELCIYWFRQGRRWTHDGVDFPRSNVIVADAYRYGQPGKVDHPTQKPLECVEPLIQASSEPGETILDCFMGSGTTLVAAVRMGRRAIGIEREPRYFAIARKRIEAELNRMPLFASQERETQAELFGT